MRRMRTWLAALAAALAFTGFAAAREEGPAVGWHSPTDALQPGESVELALTLEGEPGLNALQGMLEYDREVFQQVEQEDFTLCSGWQGVRYHPDTGRFVVYHRADRPEQGQVLLVRLTPREGAAAGRTQVRVTELTASSGQGDRAAEDGVVQLSLVGSPAQESPEPQPTQTPQPTPGQEPEPEETAQPSPSPSPEAGSPPPAQEDGGNGELEGDGSEGQSPAAPPPAQSETGGDAPAPSGQAGETQAPEGETQAPEGETQAPEGEADLEVPAQASDHRGPWLLLLALVVLAGAVGLIWHRRGGRGGGAAVLALALVGAATLCAAPANALYGRGDVNRDGQVDDGDVQALQGHLVGLELLGEDWEQADLDDSGGLSVTDLALLIRRLEKTVPYEVQLQGGLEDPYLEVGEEVALNWTAQVSHGGTLAAVTVDGVRHPLQAQPGQSYRLALPGWDRPGVYALAVTQVETATGQVVTVDWAETLEVLRQAPWVEGFSWEETAQDELAVSFTLHDPDGALLGGGWTLSLADGTQLAALPLEVGENHWALPLTGWEDYVVTVTADYDRESGALAGQGHRQEGAVLLSQTIRVDRDGIQLKNVAGHRLYYAGGDGVEEVAVLDVTDGLPQDGEAYYAVVELEGQSDFYAPIRAFRQEESGRVYGVLELEDVVAYDAHGRRQREYTFPLAYRDGAGEHPLLTSAQALLEQMAADPGGKFQLTEDLDASGLSDGAAAVAGTFTGELDGNGHRIWNLPTSLFHNLSGAYIHDLVIAQAHITAPRSGVLAHVIQNQAVVERVFLVDCTISNQVDELGAFAGNLRGATLRESGSIDVWVKGLVAVGGLVGRTGEGAVIENCSVTGKVQGTYDHPTLGARVGGLVGWHGGGVLRACYAQVQVIAPARKGNGGLIGGPNTGSPVILDSLSVSSGAGYRIAGFDVLDGMENVYEYAGSDNLTNRTQHSGDRIHETEAIFERSLYEASLGWDEAVWELELVAYGKRPSLRAAPGQDNHLGLPEYAGVLAHPEYRPQRELAYANLAQLTPHAPVERWVVLGNALPDGHPLVEQAVEMVLPLDEQGGLVAAVHRDNPGAIAAIRVVLSHQGVADYPVDWHRNLGGVAAVYQVEGLEVPYQFDGWLAGYDRGLWEQALSLAQSLDYQEDLASLTGEEESRLYVDYYREQVAPRLEQVTAALLGSGETPTYCPHPAVQAQVRQQLLEGQSWRELLYAYNYFDKWYRLDYDGVLLSHLLFFRGEALGEGLTTQSLTRRLLDAPGEQRDTHRTVVFYNETLKGATGQGLMELLGGLAQTLAGYEDPSDWMAQGFDGILWEQAPLHNAHKLRYRIWDILSGLEDGRKSIVLPILTAPQEDMYLISMPSQLMIGSLNRYPQYLTKDGGERERMEEIIRVYAGKMGVFYGVSSTWMEDAADHLNGFVHIHYDTRLNFPASSAADAGDQDADKTRDPVMKWVYEANHTISAKNGSAASADGTNVYWMQDAALGTSDYSFFTFSHENAHNQDGRYFYGGAGRRPGTGGEAHADGNIAQEMRDGCMVFNISKENDWSTQMTANFSYRRIDSAEKLWDFYQKMFETGYVLDYLAALAFLELTAAEQAAVAVQAVHTPGGTNSMSTTYRTLTEAELRDMDLRQVSDLWDNRLSIRGGAETVGTATQGSYGFESFYVMNWYQSHNDAGSPDTHSFKRLGMEMLGYGGYEAYQIYLSARSATDLDALRQITGRQDATWREYKLERFQTVADNLDRLTLLDAGEVVNRFLEAFRQDAREGTRTQAMGVKRELYSMVKRATGDFVDGIYGAGAEGEDGLEAQPAQTPPAWYDVPGAEEYVPATQPPSAAIPAREELLGKEEETTQPPAQEGEDLPVGVAMYLLE